VKPRVTQFLIGANAAVFVAMLIRGVSPTQPTSEQLLEFGADFGALVVIEGEWWRAFTSMFVHIGAIHLLFNMYALWIVGGFVERLLGRPMFLVVYVLTGLAGSFASIMWDPFKVSAGASGAIFGLFGVVAGFTFRARERLPPQTFASLRTSIVTTLLFNLLFAITSPFLDHAAHLGGLLTGLLAGVMATASALEHPSQRARWGSQLIVLATVAGLAVLADTRTKHNKQVKWMQPYSRGQVALASGDYESAVRFATEAIAVKDEARGRQLRGDAYLMLGKYDEGIEDLRKGEDTPLNKNNLAWALVRQGRDLDEAQKLADAAVLAEQNAAYLGTRCWVFVARRELERARADCEAAVKLAEDDVMDQGMLRFIEGDRAGALKLWEKAAQDDATRARDLEPWLKLAKEEPAPETAPAPDIDSGSVETADAGT